MKTREEHLAWCKENARAYLNRGDIVNAVASMMSDLSKHPQTASTSPYLALLGGLHAANHDLDGARRFIEEFR